MDSPPDIVTFSKKMLIGGFYYKNPFRPDMPYRIFNTWLGDPSKLILLKEVVKVIKNEDLISKIDQTGSHLLAGIKDAQKRFPGLVSNARGRGTFCAIDFKSPAVRDEAIKVESIIIEKLDKMQINCCYLLSLGSSS